jgi:hypothetical protein
MAIDSDAPTMAAASDTTKKPVAEDTDTPSKFLNRQKEKGL